MKLIADDSAKASGDLNQQPSSIRARLAAAIDDAAKDDTPLASADEMAVCLAALAQLWPREPEKASQSLNGYDPAAATEAGFPLPLGRFEVRGKRGDGGFGCVLRAFDPILKREVALKIPQPRVFFSKDLRRRFLLEAEAAAMLDHPGIVALHDCGDEAGFTYIVSAYCDGPDLAEWLSAQDVPISPHMAAELLLQLAGAVHYAHSRGVLHRDLKPSNVMVEERITSDSGRRSLTTRLTDFGLARQIAPIRSQSLDGAVVGTLRYLSPEQAQGRLAEVGIESDVYSLGVILYELLTRALPFAGDSDAALVRAICEDDPVPLRVVRDDIPRDLEAICFKCLEKTPERRYRSAAALAEDLQRFLSHLPVVARPAGRVERAVKWWRRNPVLSALLAGIVMLVVCGIGGILWQWRRAEWNFVQAEAHAATADRNGAIAQAAADRAERNLEQARQTLFDLAGISELSELWVTDLGSDTMRRSVRERTALYYEQLVREAGGKPLPIELQAICRMNEASHAIQADDVSTVGQALQDAIALWQSAVRERPDWKPYRKSLAQCLVRYENYLNRLLPDSTEEDVQAARAQMRSTIDRELADHDTRIEYAEVLLELGHEMYRNGRRDDAVPIYERSFAEFSQLLQQDPQNVTLLLGRASAASSVATAKRGSKDPDAGEPLLLDALRDYELAVHLKPADLDLQRLLGDTYRRIGAWQVERHDKGAINSFEKALAVLDSTLAKDPTNLTTHRAVALTCLMLGRHHRANHQNEQALAQFARASDVFSEASREVRSSDKQLSDHAQVTYDAAVLAIKVEQLDRGVSLFLRADALFEQMQKRRLSAKSLRVMMAHCKCVIGDRARREGRLTEANQQYAAGLNLIETMPRKNRSAPDALDRHRRIRERMDELAKQTN